MAEPAGIPRWRLGDPIRSLRQHLEGGGVLAIPTESSYGLAVDPRLELGVERLYRLKGRPQSKALPVVVADLEQAFALGVCRNAPLLEWLTLWWPAPVTGILPLEAPLAASNGGRSLAVRIPAHRDLRRLLRDIGFGLTATSANLSGEPAILEVRLLDELLAGTPAIIFDGGDLPGGPPSTLVAWKKGKLEILRRGAFSLVGSTTLERNP